MFIKLTKNKNIINLISHCNVMKKMYYIYAIYNKDNSNDNNQQYGLLPQVPWFYVEAFHFFALSLRQLYNGNVTEALITANSLTLYESILSKKTIYSIIAFISILAANKELFINSVNCLEQMYLKSDVDLKNLRKVIAVQHN
ncbi:hypothetical protein A3Q56_08440, partial [Intoshia linei]